MQAGGMTYRMTSAEVEHLLSDDGADDVIEALPNRITLETPSGSRYSIVPATLGGGPAFMIVR